MAGPRVRIAPSPTGYFHVGTARAALFNWLFARQHGGTFILRIEDTDTGRSRAEHTAGIERALRWLGLDWDEGPYFQSERRSLYVSASAQLWAMAKVYACDCTPDAIKARAEARGGRPGYDGFCRDRGLQPGPGRVLRFRTPDAGTTSFEDLVRGSGTLTVDNTEIEDFAVRKSNGDPLFILANVVDDADMAITHVIRGEDHISNTFKYVLLWDALAYGPRPIFAHLPLLNNEQHKKLSKRRDKVAVEDYRDEGYLPDAVVNYLALLGWSPKDDREILSRDELIAQFRLEDVRSAPAIFDLKKMLAVNGEYLRALPPEDFLDAAQAWLRRRWEALAPLVQTRVRTLGEVYPMVDFLYLPEPVIDEGQWEKERRRQPAFVALLAAAAVAYAETPWNAEAIKEATVAAASSVGVEQLGKAQAPIRLAVTGRNVGPPLFESLELLGRERVIGRVNAARTRAERADEAGSGPLG
jgi:glutamyl-tRNA synthetase